MGASKRETRLQKSLKLWDAGGAGKFKKIKTRVVKEERNGSCFDIDRQEQ